MKLVHSPREQLDVSVVIPARNALGHVRELLEALEGQTLPRYRWDVVIGDDGSTDGLATALDGRAGVRVLSGPPQSSSAARNRAAFAAGGRALAFIDADCRPEPPWLEEGLAALDDADLVGGHINWRIPEKRSIWSLLEVDTFVDQDAAVRNGTAVTGNLFVRAEFFERVGGFDDGLHFHGDFEFVARCVREGGWLTYAPKAVVWHPTADSRRYFLRKFYEANHAYARFETHAGRQPDGLKLRSWVPVVQTVRGRRRIGRPLLLNTQRLAESGTKATRVEDASAIPLTYLFLPYLRCVAQARGRRVALREQGKIRR